MNRLLILIFDAARGPWRFRATIIGVETYGVLTRPAAVIRKHFAV
jgi:hypothetical protein